MRRVLVGLMLAVFAVPLFGCGPKEVTTEEQKDTKGAKSQRELYMDKAKAQGKGDKGG